jgi:hypothetical protein
VIFDLELKSLLRNFDDDLLPAKFIKNLALFFAFTPTGATDEKKISNY